MKKCILFFLFICSYSVNMEKDPNPPKKEKKSFFDYFRKPKEEKPTYKKFPEDITDQLLATIVFNQENLPVKTKQLEHFLFNKNLSNAQKNVAKFFIQIFKYARKHIKNPWKERLLAPFWLMNYRGNSFIITRITRQKDMILSNNPAYHINHLESLLSLAIKAKNHDAINFLKRFNAADNPTSITIDNATFDQLIKMPDKETTDKLLSSIGYKL